MTDMLQMALAGFPKMLPRREIQYRRGGSHVNLECTVGRTIMDYESEHGVRIKAETRDYLIAPKDLVLDDAQVEPEEGDEIIDTNEGTTQTYQVMETEFGIAWRYTDRYHTMFRVHVREVDEV